MTKKLSQPIKTQSGRVLRTERDIKKWQEERRKKIEGLPAAQKHSQDVMQSLGHRMPSCGDMFCPFH